jgi:hypothetical protein
MSKTITRKELVNLVARSAEKLNLQVEFFIVSVLADSSEAYVELHAGSNIPVSMQQMVKILKHLQDTKDLTIAFCLKANGVELILLPDMNPDNMDELWKATMAKARDEYEASPAYVEYQRRRAIKDKEDQAEANTMLAKFDEVVKDKAQLAQWMHDFALVNDNISVVFDKNQLADKLEANGYVINEFVGVPAADFNADMAFRWAVGQAIDHLRRNMPIHPALSDHFIGRKLERSKRGGE